MQCKEKEEVFSGLEMYTNVEDMQSHKCNKRVNHSNQPKTQHKDEDHTLLYTILTNTLHRIPSILPASSLSKLVPLLQYSVDPTRYRPQYRSPFAGLVNCFRKKRHGTVCDGTVPDLSRLSSFQAHNGGPSYSYSSVFSTTISRMHACMTQTGTKHDPESFSQRPSAPEATYADTAHVSRTVQR